MQVGFVGDTHLGKTLKRASAIHGFTIEDGHQAADLVFITQDVDDHDGLQDVDYCTDTALSQSRMEVPVVLVSQVPPGYTRKWAGSDMVVKRLGPFYYQVDTIIMDRALLRASMPERIIVGCADPELPLHPNYMRWLEAFQCPILPMKYESAEMCKLAVNYILAKQVETANELVAVARKVGANWDDMVPALRLDARIGPKSYLRPGTIHGSHLPRDVKTIEQILTLGVAAAARKLKSSNDEAYL